MPLVQATDLHREYRMGDEQVHALNGVDVEIEEGEFVALLGRSGSGKSTLLNVIGGLDRPTTGRVEVADRELSSLSSAALSQYRRSTVGFIFQSFNLVPRLRAWENVGLPMVFSGHSRNERRRHALEMLERGEAKWNRATLRVLRDIMQAAGASTRTELRARLLIAELEERIAGGDGLREVDLGRETRLAVSVAATTTAATAAAAGGDEDTGGDDQQEPLSGPGHVASFAVRGPDQSGVPQSCHAAQYRGCRHRS